MSQYWKDRWIRDYAASIKLTEWELSAKFYPHYNNAKKSIERDIERVYETFADKEDITLTEAKQRLRGFELKQLSDTDFLTNTGKAKNRLTRLELMQNQINIRLNELYDNIGHEAAAVINDVYNHAMTAAGVTAASPDGLPPVSASFSLPHHSAITAAALTVYDPVSLPLRYLDKHKDKLRGELKNVLTHGLIRGDGVAIMTKNLCNRVDISRRDARRLMHTESNRAFNMGSLANYIAAGLTHYEFMAFLDYRTSQECTNMDGAVIPIDKAKPGFNIPPLHPHCRSCIAPYIGNPPTDKNRQTKDKDGNIYPLSEDETINEKLARMTDKEFEKYQTDRKMHLRKQNDKEQYERYKEKLGKDAPKSFDKFREIKYDKSQSEYEDLKKFYKYKKSNPLSDKQFYEINKEIQELMKTGIVNPKMGTAVKPIPDKILSSGNHGNERMNERKITLTDAQSYIDNAVIMFKQDNGKRYFYLSEDGGAGIMVEQKELITAYPKIEFNSSTKKIMEVCNNGF